MNKVNARGVAAKPRKSLGAWLEAHPTIAIVAVFLIISTLPGIIELFLP